MVTIKQFLGTLMVVLFSLGVYITLINQDVRIRVDPDKSTFYVKNENNRWIVSGREFNKLFDGTRRMNRDLSKTFVDTIIDNVSNTITIKRTTGFIRGPIIIDTYFFDGKLNDLELFPISHKVEIFNAKGFFYRYEVRNLIYDGITKSLSVIEMEFGRDMKITWQGNYRWARVFKSGILKVQYDISTDYEVFNVRLFDPILDSIKVIPIKKCRTEYYDKVVWDIINVTTFNTACINKTGPNTDCTTTNSTSEEKAGWSLVKKPREVCEDIGFNIGGEKLYCVKVGAKCYRDEFFINIKYPHCSDINKPSCSEGSGECCDRIDIRGLKRKPIGYSSYSNVERVKIER